MGLKINGSTSGSIEIDVPAVAGTDTAITIPATTGGEFIVSDSSGNIDLGALDISGSAAADSVNIDSSGRLLVGATSTTDDVRAVFRSNPTDGTLGGAIALQSPSNAPSDGDWLGRVDITDSSENIAARIIVACDGSTWTSGSSHPGRLVFSTTADSATSPTERMRIGSTGAIIAAGIYSHNISGTTRDVYVKDDGLLGYITSTKASKGNINALSDVDWLYQLQPKTFNYRVQDEDGAFTDDLHSELEYGLIAEEVESVAPDLCFYDETDNGQELRGVSYRKLITPLLAALQQANQRIETLETANASQAATIAAFEARLTALEGGAS